MINVMVTDHQLFFLRKFGHLPGLNVIAVGKAIPGKLCLTIDIKILQYYTN